MRLRPLSTLVCGALLAACSDRPPLQPLPSDGTPLTRGVQTLNCTAQASAATLSCTGVLPGGARGTIYGGQGQYVKLTSTNVVWNEATRVLSAEVTVQNLLPFKLGTTDGTTADTGAVKVFFNSGPTVIEGSGQVTVANADGTGSFTQSGQPFFRYAAPLAINAVSEAKTWQFQLDPTADRFQFTLYVDAAVQASAFALLTPQNGDSVSTDSLEIALRAGPPPGVNFVRASIDTVSNTLTYAGNGLWSGKLALRNVQSGPRTLRLMARAPADSTVQLVPIVVLNGRPAVFAPELAGSVAHPDMRVRASCLPNPGCRLEVMLVCCDIGVRPWFTHDGANLDTIATVPEGMTWGYQTAVRVTARDNLGRSASVSAPVWYLNDPHLAEVASGGQSVYAAGPSGIVYVDSLQLHFRELPGGTDYSLRKLKRFTDSVYAAVVTPTGAAFTVNDSLFTLRNGVLTRRGIGTSLDAEDRWVTWVRYNASTSTYEVFRYDAVTDELVLIPRTGTSPSVAANGDVVLTSGVQVWRYRNGAVTQISPAGGRLARTDGNLVVYTKGNASPQIAMWDGTSETILSALAHSYDVNNGWVAFTSYDQQARRQVFTRSPGGTLTQVTAVDSAGVRELGPQGEVLYYRYATGYHYTAPPYATANPGLPKLGSNRFIGDHLYVWLGRTAFRYDP